MSEKPEKRPLVGVAAVVWRGDQVLLIKRGKPPAQGSWSLPGGHQEWGETVKEAVLREVREETGLEVRVTRLIDVVDAIVPDKEGRIANHFTLVDFGCEWLGGEPLAGDDAADAAWFGPDELEGLGLWEETHRIIKMSGNADGGPRDFDYRKLGRFNWNVISDPKEIEPLLNSWLGREWEIDHAEFPDQPWTLEWMGALKLMKFELAKIRLDEILPRPDLMAYESGSYCFGERLEERALEREQSMLRGISIEPLVVNGDSMELMDGYTRYTVLQRYREELVFAYIGRTLG